MNKPVSCVKEIHDSLKRKCHEKGWRFKDFSGPTKKGIPGCVLTTTKNLHYYIELREPGKKATPLQKYELQGVHVFVINSQKNADTLLDTIQRLMDTP